MLLRCIGIGFARSNTPKSIMFLLPWPYARFSKIAIRVYLAVSISNVRCHGNHNGKCEARNSHRFHGLVSSDRFPRSCTVKPFCWTRSMSKRITEKVATDAIGQAIGRENSPSDGALALHDDQSRPVHLHTPMPP